MGLLAAIVAAWWRRRSVLGISSRAWLFLLLGLIQLPGMLADVVKTDSGRARPLQPEPFGGEARFTRRFGPVPSELFLCLRRCGVRLLSPRLRLCRSDAAQKKEALLGRFGIRLPARLNRIIMVAHFVSDVSCRSVYSSRLQPFARALFGHEQTTACWRDFLFRLSAEPT
jgi:hypothetical protein